MSRQEAQHRRRRPTTHLLWVAAVLATPLALVVVHRLQNGPSSQVVAAGGAMNAELAQPGTDERLIQDVVSKSEDAYQAIGAPPRRGTKGEPTNLLSNDRAAEKVAHVDRGQNRAFLTPNETAMMRANASAALRPLFAPKLVDELLQQVDHAISMETGGTFVVAGGGAEVKHYDSVTILGDTAEVKATVLHWSITGQLQDDGTVRWAEPSKDVLVTDKLVRSSDRRWLIAERTWDFAPGQAG